MLEYLEQRFPGAGNLNFVQTNGVDFPGIKSESIDFAFSFGVLVHLDFNIISEYIENLAPLMKNNGNISIQFSNKKKPMARDNPDFSDNDPEKMTNLLETNGFRITALDDDSLPHSTLITAVYSKK